MKDFNTEPLTESTVGPLILFLHQTGINNIFVRVQPHDISGTVRSIETLWKEIKSDAPFTYKFLDEEFNETFSSLETRETFLKYASVIAALIACLGLLGLASYAAEIRTKEIGIRKILGSTVPGLVYLLCRDYIKLAAAANIIVWPVVWYIMDRWLQSFPYRVDVGPAPFLLSGFAVFGIVLLAVSFQTIKAARANPVDSLRYE